MNNAFNENSTNNLKDKSDDISIEKIKACLKNSNNQDLLNYITNFHNADIADVIQNLDENIRLNFRCYSFSAKDNP